jgi:hypothetical protein
VEPDAVSSEFRTDQLVLHWERRHDLCDEYEDHVDANANTREDSPLMARPVHRERSQEVNAAVCLEVDNPPTLGPCHAKTFEHERRRASRTPALREVLLGSPLPHPRCSNCGASETLAKRPSAASLLPTRQPSCSACRDRRIIGPPPR